MTSFKKCKTSLVILFLCCILIPCSSNGTSHQRNNYWKSLHQACAQDNLEIVRLLIENGSDVNALDNNGLSSLHITCASHNANRFKIAQLLIESGADVNIPDNNGKTPLRRTCDSGNLEIAQFLIKNGAYVNTPDNNSWTLLHAACISYNVNKLEIIKLLIENGEDVNAQDKHGKTPLHATCISYNADKLEIAKLLVRHGAIVTRPMANYSSNITEYLNTICDTEEHFNFDTTQATEELLQRFIACDKNFSYVFNNFLKLDPQAQKTLLKHALLHNTNMLMRFYSCTNCDQLLTLHMLADNTYLQQKYADYRKKLPLQTDVDWWNKKTLKFANTTIICK